MKELKLNESAISSLEEAFEDTPKSDVMPYVQFSGKTGEWHYGFDQEELPEGSEVMIGALTMVKGFIGWKSGQMMGEHMASMFDKKSWIREEDLPEIEVETPMDGWSAQLGVNFVIDGKPYIFKGSSRGVTDFFNNLKDTIITRFKTNPDSVNPIVTIGTDSYKHKKFGSMIYTPTFGVIGWANDKGEIVHDTEALES